MTVIPDRRRPLADSTLGQILGLKQTRLGREGLAVRSTDCFAAPLSQTWEKGLGVKAIPYSPIAASTPRSITANCSGARGGWPVRSRT